jgi:hypothetical protein
VRFYLDEDLSPRIAVVSRSRGLDAVSAHEVGNHGLTDEEQLTYAARAGRSLLTGNVRHFAALGRRAVNMAVPHAGIILCPTGRHRRDPSGTAQALARIAAQYPSGLGEYDVIYL